MSNVVLRLLHFEKHEARVFDTFESWVSIRAQNTIRAYRAILRQWCEFLGREYGTSAAERSIIAARFKHAHAYKVWLVQHKKAPMTIGHRLVTLRAFYDHLEKMELVRANPFSDRALLQIKIEQVRPTGYMDKEQVRKLLALPNPHTKEGLRDIAVFSLLFGGALRRSEVAELKIFDVVKVGPDDLIVRLKNTKSGKNYEQTIAPWAQVKLLAYIDQRLGENALADDWLFVLYRAKDMPGTKLKEREVYRLWKKYTERLGLKNAPHTARKTAITTLLDKGVSHRDIQPWSRHASVVTVEKYDARRKTLERSPAKKLDF